MRAKFQFRCGGLVVVTMATWLGVAAPLAAQGSREDYERATARTRLDDARAAVVSVKPNWIEGQPRFWYRRDVGGVRSWMLVDAAAGTRRPLFDEAKVRAAQPGAGLTPGSKVVGAAGRADGGVLLRFEGAPGVWTWDDAAGRLEKADASVAAELGGDATLTGRPRRTRRNGESTSLTFVNRRDKALSIYWIDADGRRHAYGEVQPGESRDQHTYAGHAWVLVGGDGKDIGFTEGQEHPATVTIGEGPVDTTATPAEGPHTPARQPGESPDGSCVASLRDHNVVLTIAGEAEPIRLTTTGVAGDSFVGPVHWSPDGRYFVVMRRKSGGDRRVTYVQSSPEDQVQPRTRSYAYLKPGDDIPQERPCLFDAASRAEIALDDALFSNPWDIRDIRWAPDSSRFTFVYNQRGHTVMRVLSVDAATGGVTPIVNEECPTFFDYAGKFFLHHLDGTGEMIWMSERNGWNHLYLIDGRTGEVKNAVTSGEWVVRGVERVDEGARQVWFRAMGIVPGQDPYHVHFARVNFDGTGLTVLTEGDGTHRVEYSPDGAYLVDTYSRVDLAPVTEVRRASDGSLVVPLEGDAGASPGRAWPERFVAKGRDGVTDIWGIIIRPITFDATKRYPVIEQIYAGPHDQHVPKSFRTDWGFPAQLAELGFIVVQIDGMGTNWRSKAFHDVAWKNLKDAGFPDRIAWMKAAAAAHPEMDLENGGRGVGIYGGSAGGQNAMAALLWHGDFYKAAAADCGCHDNRMDKIWWNELWMSWPVGPHYEASSNVVNAHLLQDDGRLMLFVGEMDENVDPASTMQVVDALIRADKDFELVIVPNAGHGSAESAYGRRRRMDFFVRNLMGREPRWSAGQPHSRQSARFNLR